MNTVKKSLPDDSAPTGQGATRSGSLSLGNSLVQYAGLLGVLALLVTAFSFSSDHFFQTSTIISIANQIPDLTLIAVGMTLVLIVGGIDLSVGSVLALSSAVLGVLMVDHGWSLWAAIPCCVLTGAACGLVSGTISIGAGIPSFIVTLGMLEIARGATKVITDSQTKYIGSAVEPIGEPISTIMVSPAFLLAILAVIAGQFLLSRTVFGRYCIAIGTNAEAVRMSGIRSRPYSIAVFVISGGLCGLAGLTQTSRLSTADPNAAIGIELAAIAACVIGGTSLMGGRGNVINSFLGVLIIAVLQTGLAQLGVSDANKQIITGTVIVVAVLLDAIRGHWEKKHAV
tara:strand:- start:191888 stop:192913 length:1026 start_codon:yes stop_codon:yes gene_type:complete